MTLKAGTVRVTVILTKFFIRKNASWLKTCQSYEWLEEMTVKKHTSSDFL